MEVSSSAAEASDGGEFEGPVAARVLSPSERAALSRDTVEHVIQRFVNRNWTARAGQYEVASALWRGEDVVCTFPTSAGKTLIMMLPALLACHYNMFGVWVVCQPLEALRKTTVDKIKKEFFAGTDAVVVVWSSDLSSRCLELVESAEAVVVVFCSPEQLEDLYPVLRSSANFVHGLLVDEAHLRFAWDFRNYRASDRFSTIFAKAVIGVFSATLDRSAANELVRVMAMRNVAYFTETEFPELKAMKLSRWDQFTLRCISSSTDQVVAAVLDLFTRLPDGQAVIVFAASYAKLAKLAEPLGRPELQQFCPRLYCSAYATSHKQTTCDLLNSGRCRLVGATCALGSGVDLVNVGAVVFFGCPKTFTDAMQGMGRAGRAGRPVVEVIFAVDSSSTSKADNNMRLLMGYCSEAKSTKKVTCTLCQAQRFRPAVEDAATVYRTCFDFEGVHCARDTRSACKLTICKVFDGLLSYDGLADAALDCGRCSACRPPTIDFPPKSLVKYKGVNCVFLGQSPGQRCQIREVESLVDHTVARTSLSLVSVVPQMEPPRVKKNKLRRRERRILFGVLEERFRLASLCVGMLLCSRPSSQELAKLLKWSPKDCASQCSVKIANTDMEAWFKAAQEEAVRLAKSDKAEADGSGSDSSGGSEAEGPEMEREFPVAAVVPQQLGFIWSASFRQYLDHNLGTLRHAVAEQEALAGSERQRRRRLREEEEAAVVAAPVATPQAAVAGKGSAKSGGSKVKARRHTMN